MRKNYSQESGGTLSINNCVRRDTQALVQMEVLDMQVSFINAHL